MAKAENDYASQWLAHPAAKRIGGEVKNVYGGFSIKGGIIADHDGTAKEVNIMVDTNEENDTSIYYANVTDGRVFLVDESAAGMEEAFVILAEEALDTTIEDLATAWNASPHAEHSGNIESFPAKMVVHDYRWYNEPEHVGDLTISIHARFAHEMSSGGSPYYFVAAHVNHSTGMTHMSEVYESAEDLISSL